MSKQLVLAEKPSVARDYARILDCKQKGDGYFEGAEHVVTWSFGHLCTLKEPHDYQETWKSWKLEALPMVPEFEIKLNDDKGARAQFKVIKTLVHRADISQIVIGTDAGREGEAIARWIFELAGNKKPVLRLWVSTLTDADLKKGFADLKPAAQYDSLYDAAYARAKQDWLIGMNFTRLMTITRATGKQVLSVGRVQTPVLNLIVQRDVEIDAFQAEPYFEVLAHFDRGYKGKWVDAKNESKIATEADAQQIVDAVNGQIGEVLSVKTEPKSKPAPQLFDLTALQRQMNRRFGYPAKKTLDLAQALYEEHKILSYPRTNSRYLSDTMKGTLPGIIRRLNFGPFASFVQPLLGKADLFMNEKRYINNAEVTDHHAIIPTDVQIESKYSKLTAEQRAVFDEVALTFLAQFYADYLYNSTTVYTKVLEHLFLSRGIEEMQAGWRVLFSSDPDADSSADAGGAGEAGAKGKKRSSKGKSSGDGDASESQKLPPLNQGEAVKVEEAAVQIKKTKPPARLTEDSILALMEKYGLGTPATRAGILETLLMRKFLQRQKKQLISTELGKAFIELVDERLKSVELTSEMEGQLEAIYKNKMSAQTVLEQAIQRLREDVERLKLEAKRTFRPARLSSEINAKGDAKGGKKPTKDGEPEDKGVDSSAQEPNIPAERVIGKCPICQQMSMIESDRGFGCARFRLGCRFTIWKTMAGAEVPLPAAIELLESGRTSRKLGFYSKAGKPFEAFLKLEDGKVVFDFS